MEKLKSLILDKEVNCLAPVWMTVGVRPCCAQTSLPTSLFFKFRGGAAMPEIFKSRIDEREEARTSRREKNY